MSGSITDDGPLQQMHTAKISFVKNRLNNIILLKFGF
jgi:hypothetical protein